MIIRISLEKHAIRNSYSKPGYIVITNLESSEWAEITERVFEKYLEKIIEEDRQTRVLL